MTTTIDTPQIREANSAQASQSTTRNPAAPMRVSYMSNPSDTAADNSSADLRILVPGGQSAFQATYTQEDGRLQRALVRAPLLSVIPAGQAHAISWQPNSDAVMITIDSRFFDEKARQILGNAPCRVVERHAAVDPFLRDIGDSLRSDFRKHRFPTPEYLVSLASVVATHIARNYSKPTAAPEAHAGLAPHKLARVQAFVREHLGEPLKVERLAEHIHMSPYHFARMFKLATGQTPHTWILLQRIARASELLTQTDMPLLEVGASVGFLTQGHFTAVFHRYTGTTPRVYRVKSRQALNMSTPLAQPAASPMMPTEDEMPVEGVPSMMAPVLDTLSTQAAPRV